ncbi:GntR family transcriptional regulator [Micromonospora halophytica]|uniref:Regulatory protein, gntR family n=1 Tax=Micromonospora halophytica TaxID=47864 RepID=A0A1C5J0D2_9ACTN|nr:GntR family transcriptional regulator [Micromonospora halophytica]SCG64042.1 regulatory protein, gntR family [Micromonospora halophytica]
MIDPWSPRSFAEQLADVLRAKIDSGEWQPGHKLPGEVTLAQTYDVARGTVRAALDQLREEGRVVTFTGRGTFVTPEATGTGNPDA